MSIVVEGIIVMIMMMTRCTGNGQRVLWYYAELFCRHGGGGGHGNWRWC